MKTTLLLIIILGLTACDSDRPTERRDYSRREWDAFKAGTLVGWHYADRGLSWEAFTNRVDDSRRVFRTGPLSTVESLESPSESIRRLIRSSPVVGELEQITFSNNVIVMTGIKGSLTWTFHEEDHQREFTVALAATNTFTIVSNIFVLEPAKLKLGTFKPRTN